MQQPFMQYRGIFKKVGSSDNLSRIPTLSRYPFPPFFEAAQKKEALPSSDMHHMAVASPADSKDATF